MAKLTPQAVEHLMKYANQYSWEQLARGMKTMFGIETTAEACRSKYRRMKGGADKRTPGGKLLHTVRKHGNLVPEEQERRLVTIIKGKPKQISDVRQAMGLGAIEFGGIVTEMRAKGHDIRVENGHIWLNTSQVASDRIVEHDEPGANHFRIMVVSDTHLGSKYQQLTSLNAAYDDAIARGVDFVMHVGDLVDGVYRDRLDEIFLIGYDAQLDYVVKHYPRRVKADGSVLRTHMISGNHDGTFKKDAGADIVMRFAQLRDDVTYLGEGMCQYMLTEKCKIDLIHPLDGSAYAVSYSAQKLADAYMGGEKPNILLIGHHHKEMVTFYRNIHICEVPSLQEQTPWMRRKRLYAAVGWYILDIEVDETGGVGRFRHEFVPQYVMRKHDY